MPRPKGGYKLRDGTKVTGVTTITGRFKESGGLLQWAFNQGASGAESLYEKRDEAADIGTYVHELWHRHLIGLEPLDFPEDFSKEQQDLSMMCYESAIRWKDQTKLKITPLENSWVSEHYKFGGTPDALTESGEWHGIGDWKTGDLYPEAYQQLAAYELLAAENMPEMKITEFHLVRFGKAGQFVHVSLPSQSEIMRIARRQFIRLIDCFYDDKMLKKLL